MGHGQPYLEQIVRYALGQRSVYPRLVRPAIQKATHFSERPGPPTSETEARNIPSRMRIRRLAIAALLLAVACNAPSNPCPPISVGLWSADGEAEVYAGDHLFVYINGGAEIYHEYGFQQLTVQRYRRGDDRVSVEIYTMDGDAFGIYSFARSGNGRPVNLGNGATAADYYMHLWSGHDLAAITAENDFEDFGEALSEIGAAVAACMPPGGAEPDLLVELPTEDRVPGSEIYFTGQLAFINAARPAATFFSGFAEGAFASYGPEKNTVVLKWQDETVAEQALRAARQMCTDSGGTIIDTGNANGVKFKSGVHQISGSGVGNLITLRITKEES